MRVGWVLLVSAVVVVLSGCTPGTAPTTPAPTPAFMCTPEAGGAESACSEQDFDKMKAKDAQYAEAEKVYREYQAEYERVIRAGGANALTPKLEQVLGTGDLRKSLLVQLKEFKAQGLRIEGPGTEVKSAKREPTREMNGSVVAMTFCIDASGTRVINNGRTVRHGVVARETSYFGPADSRMSILATTFKTVKSCDA